MGIGQPPSTNGVNSMGGPVQYIQIPEYQQQTQGGGGAPQTSPSSSIHPPLGGSNAGGSMPHSPSMSRKRRSRSPVLMDDDRYGPHHAHPNPFNPAPNYSATSNHPHHSSNAITSNVRGTEDGDESDNEEFQGLDSSDDDQKPDPDADSANNDYSMFPANLLAEEKRASFFKTILNPAGPDGSPHTGGSGGSASGGDSVTGSDKGASRGGADGAGGSGGGVGGGHGTSGKKRDVTQSPTVSGNPASGSNGLNGADGRPKHTFSVKKPPPTFDDPITMGLITEEEAKTLFELCVAFFVRRYPLPFCSSSHARTHLSFGHRRAFGGL